MTGINRQRAVGRPTAPPGMASLNSRRKRKPHPSLARRLTVENVVERTASMPFAAPRDNDPARLGLAGSRHEIYCLGSRLSLERLNYPGTFSVVLVWRKQTRPVLVCQLREPFQTLFLWTGHRRRRSRRCRFLRRHNFRRRCRRCLHYGWRLSGLRLGLRHPLMKHRAQFRFLFRGKRWVLWFRRCRNRRSSRSRCRRRHRRRAAWGGCRCRCWRGRSDRCHGRLGLAHFLTQRFAHFLLLLGTQGDWRRGGRRLGHGCRNRCWFRSGRGHRGRLWCSCRYWSRSCDYGRGRGFALLQFLP
jgi:hypothetical protein